jgi:hypothetical protein
MCMSSSKVLNKFVDDCNNAICMAEMLEGGQVQECKDLQKEMESLNNQAETHAVGVKAALKKYAEFK